MTGDEIKELKAKLITEEAVKNNPRLIDIDCYDIYALAGCIWLSNGVIVIEICEYVYVGTLCIIS